MHKKNNFFFFLKWPERWGNVIIPKQPKIPKPKGKRNFLEIGYASCPPLSAGL
jgi:hypothetical protein